ncbi:MAG: hypothetical protein ACLFQV_08200, partial [Vulcanimicrobiota bacterium]
DNDFIPKLWSLRRIGYLLEVIRQKGENPELVDEVIRLSKEFGIITPYTSFLVEEPRDEKKDRVGMPRAVQSKPASPLFNKAAKYATGQEAFATSQNLNMYQQADSAFEAEEAAPVESHNKVKRLHGKTFYLIDDVWTDSEYEGKEKMNKVKLYSDEYFELIKDSRLARYLSAGEKVLIKYKGTVYLIEK